MSVVLDASAAVAVLAPSQATDAARTFFAESRVWRAPDVLRIEVRNVLLRLERRGALPRGDADADLDLLESAIAFGPAPSSGEHLQMLTLARRFALNAYDATYLAFTLRNGLELASRDGPLMEAAKQSGVGVHDLR